MLVKVLQPLKTRLFSSPAVFRDSNDPILGQCIDLVPRAEVVVRFKDDEGWNRPSARVDTLGDCYPLPVARLYLLWLS